MPKDCDGAVAQDVNGRLQEQVVVTHFRVMAFFTALTEAIASRQSLFVAGLDPNPEMLRHWASSRNLSGRSLLSQARACITQMTYGPGRPLHTLPTQAFQLLRLRVKIRLTTI